MLCGFVGEGVRVRLIMFAGVAGVRSGGSDVEVRLFIGAGG